MSSVVGEQKPPQQTMDPATTQQPAIDWNSLVMPGVYDPPQVRRSVQPGCLKYINWLTRDSPLCNSFPCCLSQCMITCCLKPCFKKEQVDLSDPDEWFRRMLRAENPKCPERLRGVWWMKDNILPEEVCSFGDAEWVPGPGQNEMVGHKKLHQNWAYGTNVVASVLQCLYGVKKDGGPTLVVHGKWVFLGAGPAGDSYMKLLEEGDEIVCPDGSKPRYTPGLDGMRVTFGGESGTDVGYQYLARKIAYLDDMGNLVKTDGYDELIERTRLAGVQGTCCNLGLCNIPEDKYPEIWKPESGVLLIEIPPSRTE